MAGKIVDYPIRRVELIDKKDRNKGFRIKFQLQTTFLDRSTATVELRPPAPDATPVHCAWSRIIRGKRHSKRMIRIAAFNHGLLGFRVPDHEILQVYINR